MQMSKNPLKKLKHGEFWPKLLVFYYTQTPELSPFSPFQFPWKVQDSLINLRLTGRASEAEDEFSRMGLSHINPLLKFALSPKCL